MGNNDVHSEVLEAYNGLMEALNTLQATVLKRANLSQSTFILNGRINSLALKIDELEPLITEYVYDKPKELTCSSPISKPYPKVIPINTIYSDDIKNIALKNNFEPIRIFLFDGESVISGVIAGHNTYILNGYNILRRRERTRTAKENQRLASLLSRRAVTLINSGGNRKIMVINDNITFKSANTFASFILDRTITNGVDIIMTEHGTSLKNHLDKLEQTEAEQSGQN